MGKCLSHYEDVQLRYQYQILTAMLCCMNKNEFIIACMLLFVATVSCKKPFEDKPLEMLTIDYIFDPNDPSGDQASKWISYIYSRIQTGCSRLNSAPLETVSHDAVREA